MFKFIFLMAFYGLLAFYFISGCASYRVTGKKKLSERGNPELLKNDNCQEKKDGKDGKICENGNFMIKARPVVSYVNYPITFEGKCGEGKTIKILWDYKDGKKGESLNNNKITHVFTAIGKYAVEATCKESGTIDHKGVLNIEILNGGLNPGQNPGQNPSQNPR